VQETKWNSTLPKLEIEGYNSYFYNAEKNGYSGTAVFSRTEPLSVTYGLEDEEFNHEGRVITLEYPDFYYISVYVPNSQDELKRIGFRVAFDEALQNHIRILEEKKGVVVTGDMNVAITPKDIFDPKRNEGKAGYSEPERASFRHYYDMDMIDTFRLFHPEEVKYSWWSYRMMARAKGIGWRIDYCLASKSLGPRLRKADILDQVMGSDHAPVMVELE
ncbi:MAG: exodeoxyribonuclease III, partial [Spirochaetales bacterium]|nr:exodeoxyribonuclease III [Candidatus Physcosoma equi]